MDGPRTRPRHVDVVTGAFFLIKKDVWSHLQGFDPVYFLYSEEVDLCYRARKIGVRPNFTPKVRVRHQRGASMPNRGKRLAFLLKGKITFIRRHWSPLACIIGRGLLVAWPFSRVLILTVVARLSPQSSAGRTLLDWQTVWGARYDWSVGYQPADPKT